MSLLNWLISVEFASREAKLSPVKVNWRDWVVVAAAVGAGDEVEVLRPTPKPTPRPIPSRARTPRMIKARVIFEVLLPRVAFEGGS